ncbi:MAG: SPFH domain-containing protein [Clostridia bacterium]|nr:SPFH domain-containing protein [Clostridia bacterium]
MGIFSFFKKQLLEVIEWKDDSKDTVVYRFPLKDREEIMTSSTLVVRPSQCAIFVHKGQVADVFAPGTYKLKTENIPFLTKILSLPTGFESPIKAEVYFVNTKQFTAQKWGTQNPIMMRDADFGNVRLRGFGVYSFKVEDAKVFMQEMFGTNHLYTTSEVAEYMRPMLVQGITDAIAESKISALDLASSYNEFADTVVECAQPKFAELGLKLCNVVIENISLPEEVEKVLDERTKLGVLEDKMGTFTQYQAAQALRDAAQNEGGSNLAGLGVGLGAGANLGGTFADAVSSAKNTKREEMALCKKCGASIKKNAKFCPECGETQAELCPKCQKPVPAKAKFCPECGEKISKTTTCPKCKTELKKGTKFCPECGTKI